MYYLQRPSHSPYIYEERERGNGCALHLCEKWFITCVHTKTLLKYRLLNSGNSRPSNKWWWCLLRQSWLKNRSTLQWFDNIIIWSHLEILKCRFLQFLLKTHASRLLKNSLKLWISILFQYVLTTAASFVLDIIILAIYEPIGRAQYEREECLKIENWLWIAGNFFFFCRYWCSNKRAKHISLRFRVRIISCWFF